MKKGGNHSITRIRTFDEDIARARGIETSETPTATMGDTTAQEMADSILKNKKPKVTNFFEETPKSNQTLTPANKITVNIPDKEIIKAQKDKPSEPEVPTPPPANSLVLAGLEEDIRTIGARNTKSVQTTEGAVYDVSNNDLGEGTIITNKKSKRHRLIPSIFAAITSWFTTTKTELTTPKKSEHTISNAESRIATITAAARASNHAPHNDHDVVVKRLTKVKKKSVPKEVTITKKEDIPTPQWSSSIEPDSIRSTEPIIRISTEERPISPVEVAKIDVQSVAEPIEILPVSEPEILENAPLETTPEPANVDQKPTEVTVPPVEKKEGKVSHKERTYRAAPASASGVSIYVYIMVIVGASLLGIGASVYWFMSATAPEEAVVIRVPSLFTAERDVAVTLASSRADTLSTVLDLSIAGRETTQIYPVVTDTAGLQTPADAQTTLAALAFRAPGSFTRSVTSMTFGSYNGTDPFILMKVTNFDTAFGGILDWEPDMSEDLTPLFGPPVTQSYDPYSRSDTQIRSAFFRDTIVANKSARLLVDAEDDERLIYSFVQPNLILITSNSDTFKAVLPLVTQ